MSTGEIDYTEWQMAPGFVVTRATAQHDNSDSRDILVTLHTHDGELVFYLSETVAETLYSSLSLTLRMDGSRNA